VSVCGVASVEFVGFLILVGVVIWIASAAFNAGKHEGSRKAYGVGFERGRRSRAKAQSGCLLVVVLIFSAAATFIATVQPEELLTAVSQSLWCQFRERAR
jgi:hypothetical protein